jgi:hypothetical protein
LEVNIYIRPVLFILLFILIPAVQVLAQEQCDFDGDGTSDLTYLGSNGTALTWNYLPSQTTGTTSETFGLTSDQISLAHWLDPNAPTLGIVRLSAKKSDLIWKIPLESGLLAEEIFGKAESVFLAGGDFDGNGIADAAVVERGPRGLKWSVRLNMFSGEDKKTVKFKLGSEGDRVFFLNPEGEKDWAGVFGRDSRGRAVLTLRNLSTKKKLTIKKINKSFLNGGNSRPRPFPIKSDDGTDVIGFLGPSNEDPTDSRLTVYALDGTVLAKAPFQGTGTFAVGNFDPDDPGEEVAFQSTGSLQIFNPFSGANTKKDAFAGTLIDEISIENVHAPTPLPTAVPTATVVPTETATPEGE